MGRFSREVLWDSCIGSRPDPKIPATMATPNSQTIIEEFLAHVSKLADDLRAAVIQEAHAAFAGLAAGERTGNGLRANKPGPKPKALKAAPEAKGGRVRRDPSTIEKQAAQILGFVKKHPGSRAEVIGKALGFTATEMQIPIANLLTSKVLKKAGERRATSYTAK